MNQRVQMVQARMAHLLPHVDILFVADSVWVPSEEYVYLTSETVQNAVRMLCVTSDSVHHITPDLGTFLREHHSLHAYIKSGRVVVESSIEGALFDSLSSACASYGRQLPIERLSVVAEVRREKTAEEIECMNAGQCELLHMMRRDIPTYMYEGMTEYELAQKVENLITKNRTWKVSFPAIVAFGEHGAIPHHRPGERRLKNGEPVLIDCGNIYMNCVCTDMTRNYWFGDTRGALSEEYRADYERLQHAQEAVTPLYTIGNKTAAADSAVREYVGDMPHGLGHGIAQKSVHALPYISSASAHLFQRGDVVTNEPGIYREGAYGMRIEDVIAITQGGPRVFGDSTESRGLIEVPHRLYDAGFDGANVPPPVPMSIEEQRKNIARIQARLREHGAYAYICAKTEESTSNALEVLMGFQGTHGYLFVTTDNAFFITDGRYEGMVRPWKDAVGITPCITRRARHIDGVEFPEITTATYLKEALDTLTVFDTKSVSIHLEPGASLCAEVPLLDVLKTVGFEWSRQSYI